MCIRDRFHDCTEIITGDMPTPVKYFNPQIKDAYREVEAVAAEKEMLSGKKIKHTPSKKPANNRIGSKSSRYWGF